MHKDSLEDGSSISRVFGRLPNSQHINIEHLEEKLPMKSQWPENGLVILETMKLVLGIPEYNILSVDIICTEQKELLAQGVSD